MPSKIFMGDMPELMENILNNLNNEFKSLYSYAFVSRHWCKVSIPILWQDPFSIEKKFLSISKYFSSLGEDDKLALKGYGINVEFSNTLFDYARFLKVLDLSRLGCAVLNYLELFNPTTSFKDPSINFIINLLFKLFIESGATLRKLVLDFSYFIKIKPEIFNSLEQNMQFFSRLQNLSLDIASILSIEHTTTLLRIMLFQAVIRIIKSQERLRKFSLAGEKYPAEFHGIISALKSQKNSLQEVIIERCYNNAEFEVMKNCENIETLRMRSVFDYPVLLNILNCKISTLEIVNFQINASTIVQLLEHSGKLLQQLKLDYNKILNESLLLEAIKSFCPNITYLNISNIGFSTKFIELISNLQKLQFFTLRSIVDIPEEKLKIRVKQFAEILPLTLQYLDLVYNYSLQSYVDILLNNCNAPLKKLLIHGLDNEKNTKALLEFCIRNRSLNYLGVFRYWELDDNFRKNVESYVTLVPYRRIVVNC
ncbi:hypothetical protein F8M41_017216 [Gigaspora margarita]|uniref:F-box domain-containing protein n=1 Tax=Gigaspora margarita TaxID=4874 RepID=A0A8H4B2W8_GIGMA|nr:hypothetical protein F8M41_017216 [Gigaspora margarita]